MRAGAVSRDPSRADVGVRDRSPRAGRLSSQRRPELPETTTGEASDESSGDQAAPSPTQTVKRAGLILAHPTESELIPTFRRPRM